MKRHALFVGVDQYVDASFRNLRHSVSDAAALAGAFGRHGYETHVLTNPKADEVLEEVERRSSGLGPGDVFLFFFAGHGFTAQGGEHLLICANDRLPFLRCNRAGIPVDLLEELTNGRGFHRAFLLDACRTDVFAGMESRGAETRDLALISLPDAKANPGTCSVLRSCDRFCPALEFDDLGHGVFTQAVLGAMDGDALALPFGETFVACVRERMGDILRAHGVPADQAPAFQTNGAPFALFALRPRTAFAATSHVISPKNNRTMRRFALFVGIDTYGGRHSLRCARADAETLYYEFSKYYDKTQLLVDNKASRKKIIAAVVGFRKLMRPGDMFLFYFSGHGGDFDGERLLEIPDYDAQGHRIGLTDFSTSELRDKTDVKGLHRLFILDCCRNKQPVERNLHERAVNAVEARGFVDRHGPDTITPPTILSSSSPGQTSYENDSTGHGYFTEAFLETLRDASVRNFNEFRDRLDAVMTDMDAPGDQLPYFEGPIGSDFPFWPEWEAGDNGGDGNDEDFYEDGAGWDCNDEVDDAEEGDREDAEEGVDEGEVLASTVETEGFRQGCNECSHDSTKKRVTFTFAAESGREVYVAGDFNGWDPIGNKLADKNGDGTYTCAISLEPGTYEYKFFIDGAPCIDPNCNEWRQNAMGTLNSVLHVE